VRIGVFERNTLRTILGRKRNNEGQYEIIRNSKKYGIYNTNQYCVGTSGVYRFLFRREPDYIIFEFIFD